MSLPVITYKVTNSNVQTSSGFTVTNFIISNVFSQYSRNVQEGDLTATYKCYNTMADIGVKDYYLLSPVGDKGIITYQIPTAILREYNPEQFPLVEKQMLADTFSIDSANIEIQVDGIGVPDSTFA